MSADVPQHLTGAGQTSEATASAAPRNVASSTVSMADASAPSIYLSWPGATQGLAIQAAMVDLDGTMVDTLGDFEVALNRMLAELQLPSVSREFISQTVGKGSEHLIRTVLAEQMRQASLTVCESSCPATQPEARYEQAWRSYQTHYHTINGQFAEVFAGVREGLQKLHVAGLPMACLTNKPQAHAEALLEALDLRQYFQLVFGGDAFPRKKPDPMPLLETAKALRTPPQATLMLGDSSNDAQAAHAAGCPVLLVSYGYNHGEPIRAVSADGYLDSLSELVAAPLAG